MLTGKIGVTTARNATGSAAAAQARAWAEQLGALYVERPHNMGVDELMAQHDLAALVVGEKDGPRIQCRRQLCLSSWYGGAASAAAET